MMPKETLRDVLAILVSSVINANIAILARATVMEQRKMTAPAFAIMVSPASAVRFTMMFVPWQIIATVMQQT